MVKIFIYEKKSKKLYYNFKKINILFFLFKQLHVIHINFDIIENYRPLQRVKIGIGTYFLDEFQKL